MEFAPESKSAQNCGKSFASMFCIEGGQTRYQVIPLKCGSWDCKTCRRRKALLYRRLIDRVFCRKQVYMWTLTYYHSSGEETAWKNYNNAWNHLATLIRQRHGPFGFVRVLETHKTSCYPHLHVLTDLYVGAVEFGHLATAAGFGYQMNWKRIDDVTAGSYISKYLTKPWPREDSLGYRRTLRLRIVTMSRGLYSKPVKCPKWTLLTRYGSQRDCLLSVADACEWGHDVIVVYDNDQLEGGFIDIECSGVPGWMWEQAWGEYSDFLRKQLTSADIEHQRYLASIESRRGIQESLHL
jgi:hypothetical protein